MSSLGSRVVGQQDGQALILFVVVLFVFAGLAAVGVDLGVWMTKQRQAQAAVDAAALAGAQELPFSQADAIARATAVASDNDFAVTVDPSAGGLCPGPSSGNIRVEASRVVPGLFSKLAGITHVTVKAHACARVEPPTSLNSWAQASESGGDAYLVPIVVDDSVACSAKSCLNDVSTLSFGDFGVVCPDDDCDDDIAGSISKPTFGTVSVGDKLKAAKKKDVSDAVGVAIQAAADDGRTLIVPVVKHTSGKAKVEGFAAFVPTGSSFGGGQKEMSGYFTTYTTKGPLQTNAPSDTNYGVRVIGLTS